MTEPQEYITKQIRSMLVNDVAVVGGQTVTCCVGERFTINACKQKLGLAEAVSQIVDIVGYNNVASADSDMRGPDRGEWKHEAASAQRFK